jgi:PKD repeat protein
MENRIYPEEFHTIQITVTTRKTTDFKIEVGLPSNPSFNQSYTVMADSSLTVAIPWRIAESIGSETRQNMGIHLTSNELVSVFARNWSYNSTDITAIFPVETLGKEYYAMCYEPHFDANPLRASGRNSEFLVVATEDQTTVKITPSKVTDKLAPKDSTFTRILNRGESFQVQSANNEGWQRTEQGDLTGSHIVADKPVAFFSGSLSTTVPYWQCCWDHLYEQIPPVQSWGREYLTVPLKTRSGDRFRILAAKNNTTVQISGEPLLYLDAGQFHEFEVLAPETKSIISDNPILVAQFSQSRDVDFTETNGNGDPFMIILNPADRQIKTAIFQTYGTPNNFTDSIYFGIQSNYVNILTFTNEITNIRFNGQPITAEFKSHNQTGWSYAQLKITEGTHQIENSLGNEGFMAYVYGFGGFESYGFNAGYNFDIKLDLGENIEFFNRDTLLLCRGDKLILDAGPQFDYYSWSTLATTQTISVVEEGLYWVEAGTHDGCVLRDTVFVYESKPVADLGERYAEICYPQKVFLQADEDYEKYIWQNETDEIISTDLIVWADKTGEYRLTVVDKYRCIARDTLVLTVFPVPEIEILGDHLICGETSTQLSVIISGTPENIWNFPGNFSWSTNSSDVILSDESRFSVNVEASKWGDYEILYRLTTIDACDTIVVFPIRFHPQPESDFVIEDDAECSGYSKILRFTGVVTEAAEFEWDLNGRVFLDTLDPQNRVYLISEGALQNTVPPVSLIINDKGCISDPLTKPVLNAKPNFTMEADKTRGCDFLTVNFSSRLLTAGDVDFVWTFDNDEIMRQQNYTKHYADTGFYKANLTITNRVTNCRNSFTIDSMIKVFPTPVAEISADPSVCYPDSILIFYTNSIDSSVCLWEFDGIRQWGTGNDSVHVIIEQPTGRVKLTVNEYGCISDPVELQLKRKPLFDFFTESVEGCQPYSFEVFAETKDNFIGFSWVTDSLPYPTGISNLYYLPDTGRFDVSLIAFSNETGCADTLLKPGWIWVHRNPYAKFEVDYPVALIDNANIRFINYAERAVNYFWDFGDGATSEDFEPVHSYTQLGDYNTRLIAESIYGCLDTFELGLKIIPSTVYSPNAFRPGSDIAENQTFMPVGAGVDPSRFNLKIFNRWGDLVFETSSLYTPWDGTLKNGKDAPQGNYVWISKYYDIQGFEHNEKGQVLLIR